MIHFMLDDLRRKTGVGLYAYLHLDGLIPHLYGSIPLAQTRSAK